VSIVIDMKTGDRVNALYLSKRQGTSLAMGRKVLTVEPREDGWLHITVELPKDAALEFGSYNVPRSGESDYISKATGRIVNCDGCGADIYVTDERWADLALEELPCWSCSAVVDLGRSRQTDAMDFSEPGYYLQCGVCSADVFVTEELWNDRAVELVPHEGCTGGADLAHARRHAD
jgi:hypothetical protein